MEITEWLPNPSGPEGKGEWLELWNNSENYQSLLNWQISDGKKTKNLPAVILSPKERLVLDHSQIGFALTNQNGKIFLIDPARNEKKYNFWGSAPEGKSVNFGSDAYFANPTPGLPSQSLVDNNSNPTTPSVSSPNLIWLGLVLGIIFAAWAIALSFENNDLHHYFFQRN